MQTLGAYQAIRQSVKIAAVSGAIFGALAIRRYGLVSVTDCAPK